MSERNRATALVICVLLVAGTAGGAETPASLLAATDLFARAPAELRLELEIGAEGGKSRTRLELFRAGPERALVRFLAPHELGKFVLRIVRETWFLAPGARPVRLGDALRLQGGAALDELLGLSLARDYRIESYEEQSGIGTFELVALAPAAATPRVRWVVDLEQRRPRRADLLRRDGKPLRVVEFRGWLDPERLIPSELAIADLTRGTGKLIAHFVAYDAAPLDPALFALDDGGARARLPTPTGPPP